MLPVLRRNGFGLTRLQDEMNDLFGRFLSEPWGETTPSFWPAMEITEKDDDVVVRAELPGMKADDIDISVQGNTLTISGAKKEESEHKDAGFYRSERRYGHFSRSLTLPTDVNAEKIDAMYRDGVLTITLPKSETAKPRKISVKK